MSSTLTVNKNYLGPTGYRLTIDQTRFANLEYFCINAQVPGVQLQAAPMPFRNISHAISGDRVEYSMLDIKFIVDEEMKNYVELFNWLRDNSLADAMTKSDIVLTVHSAKNNVVKKIRFVDAFPTVIGDLNFDSQLTEVTHIVVDASFHYTYFEFLT